MQTYKIHIEGYWRDKNKNGIPDYAGIYFVYTSKYNDSNDTVTLIKPVYVGESENVKEGIIQNVSFAYWRSFLAPGEELCFSVAEMASSGRTAVRAAIVFELKPAANTEFKDSQWQTGFEVLITGRTRLLPDHLKVP
ncbi:MAG: GIY-YIG nuclease family protein [Bacteroidota bacterium]|nr:GIY-YIG nuclease family protein [Bacteroidota bacterium]MDP4257422.1 GIY-YIG nuclease family protein [Bacteroidota bacterium]